MSLVTRLVLLIALAMVPVLAAQLFSQVELWRERAGATRIDAVRYARLVSSDAERVIEGVKSILVAVSEVPFIRKPDPPACTAYLAGLAKRYPQVLNMTLIDEVGTPICANTPIRPGATGSDRYYFQQAMRTNDFVVGEYIVGRTVPEPQLPVALPFTDDSGHRFVLSIGLDFDWLQAHFGNLTLPPGALLRIADRNGIVIVAPGDRALIGLPLPATFQPARGVRDGAFDRRDSAGQLHIVGVEALSASLRGLIVAVDLSPEDIGSRADADNERDLLISLVSALAAVGAAWFGGRHFLTRPLRILTVTAEAWTGGNYGARTGLANQGSEIGRLGSAFDQMADVVQSNQHTLRSMNETLEQRVAERTAALSEANLQLENSMAEREKIELALRQAQKMEAVGQLTGGIAHDFNNLLTIIIGNLDLAIKKMDPRDALRRYIVNARTGGERAAALTRHLLAFSRQQVLQPTSVDPNKLIRGMSEFMQRALGPSIEIETVLTADPWHVTIDAGQLENTLLNLCINARDAMPNGGKLTIETANTCLDQAYAASHPEVTPGPYVLIGISDTGTGMPSDVIAKIFDPFFTTKPVGSGSGLGLSMVYGFVKQSRGHINVYSEVGQGTSFKLYLPRHAGNDEVSPAGEVTAQSTGGGGERILLVEDDDAVRDYAAAALTDLGYLVIEAADATAALAVLNSPEPLDLMFTDVGLPGQNGRKLAEDALRIRPQMPVLFTTGYTRNAIVHHGILDAGVVLLPKPFTVAALAAKIREALAGA
jgi:signal transduction histidine kinase